MPCEQTTADIPVTPSLAALTDYVWVTLPDGTTVLRPWAQFVQTLPSDVEEVVAATGGDINNGDTDYAIAAHAGLRVRFIRNGILQSRVPNATGFYYDFDNTTGNYTFTPVASTDELFQFQAY